jgi:hypothetical protein
MRQISLYPKNPFSFTNGPEKPVSLDSSPIFPLLFVIKVLPKNGIPRIIFSGGIE